MGRSQDPSEATVDPFGVALSLCTPGHTDMGNRGALAKKSDSEGRVTLTQLSGTYTNMCELTPMCVKGESVSLSGKYCHQKP